MRWPAPSTDFSHGNGRRTVRDLSQMLSRLFGSTNCLRDEVHSPDCLSFFRFLVGTSQYQFSEQRLASHCGIATYVLFCRPLRPLRPIHRTVNSPQIIPDGAPRSPDFRTPDQSTCPAVDGEDRSIPVAARLPDGRGGATIDSSSAVGGLACGPGHIGNESGVWQRIPLPDCLHSHCSMRVDPESSVGRPGRSHPRDDSGVRIRVARSVSSFSREGSIPRVRRPDLQS